MKALLESLGLNSSEAKVYLALLKLQRASPAEIAKATKLNRPTVYNIVKNLVSRNLLVEDAGSKTLYVSPAPPAELKQLIKKEEDDFKRKSGLIEELVEELQKIRAEDAYPVPKIRFIEEEGLRSYLYARTPAWNAAIKAVDGFWWGFQDQAFLEEYGEWITWYWEEGSEGQALRLLSNQSQAESRINKKYAKREIKFWNKPIHFTTTTWILGEFIVMIRASKKPFYLVEINDATLAHNLREVFKNLWSEV